MRRESLLWWLLKLLDLVQINSLQTKGFETQNVAFKDEAVVDARVVGLANFETLLIVIRQEAEHWHKEQESPCLIDLIGLVVHVCAN